MKHFAKLATRLSPAALLLAGCSASTQAETSDGPPNLEPFAMSETGTFEYPWAARFIPGTDVIVVNQVKGQIIAHDPKSGQTFEISGAPEVDFGGQGGFGDVAFLNSEAGGIVGERTIYISWVEAGDSDTRGAVAGKGTLTCTTPTSCAVEDLSVIWRQAPKTTGRGHYAHRFAISPDEKHLFIASGDRQKLEPAQDNSNNIGTIVRLNLDGSPAQGNPVSENPEIWSYGHRNPQGLAFAPDGQL